MAIKRTGSVRIIEGNPYTLKKPAMQRAWQEGYEAALEGAVADDGAGGVVIPADAWERMADELAIVRAVKRVLPGYALIHGPEGDWFVAPVKIEGLDPSDETQYGGYGDVYEALDMAGLVAEEDRLEGDEWQGGELWRG